ncbi:porin [Celeribacter marinus]|uniref:porin n=1 Tax=Celeribacter marinus TaxID=1397108 RepID=UPI0031821994
MKNILLSSVAIVAFAGAAAAEVSFSGDVTLGYNNDVEDGFYADAGLDVAFSAELNNGWTAGGTVGADMDDLTNGTAITVNTDFTAYVESDMGGLYFGEYTSAVDQLVSSPEGLTDGMSDYDDDDIGDNGEQLVLKTKFGAVEAAVSAYVLSTGKTDGTTVAVKGSFGTMNFSLGHDAGDAIVSADAATNLNVGTTFGGADVTVGFASVGDDTNYGIEVGYPVGPVALSVWYATGDQASVMGLKGVYADGPVSVTAKAEKVEGADTTFNLEGTYDMGNGLMIGAGTVDGEGEYLAGKYDLGGGASFLASYANATTPAGTDIGDAYDGTFELKDGVTLAVSLSF